MRAFAPLLLLAACERDEPAPAPLAITCTPDGGASARCGLTCAEVDGRTMLTVTEPDGGFRRLAVSLDGASATADGAAPARVAPSPNGTLEVTVEGDRYSVPAR